MWNALRRVACYAVFVGLATVAQADAANMNKSIRIDSGSQSDGESTVNGSITVEGNAVVSGSLETVNGRIRIGDGAQLQDASTVNGRIRIGSGVSVDDVESVNGSIGIDQNATIAGDVSVVNGRIDLESGGNVAGDVSNVNGELRIVGTEIGGSVTTVSGDIWVTDNSTVRGDVVVEGRVGLQRRKKPPKVVIGPGSRVLGEINAEREIELFISDTAEVAAVVGEVSLADAVRFSGGRP